MKYLRKFETTDEFDAFLASDNYIKPNVSLIAGTSEIKYNILVGAFIQHIDGSLYTKDEWTTKGFTSDQANGVAVFTPTSKFVIGKTSLSAVSWSSNINSAISDVMLTNDVSIAKTDYAGEANTAFIVEASTYGAAKNCANFTFPNGAKGYLPALGEWNEAYTYKAGIDTAMTLIGGDSLTGEYWSSTQHSSQNAWRIHWSSGSCENRSKSSYLNSRPFTSL